MREFWVRADRVPAEIFDILWPIGLPVNIINPYDGWCDEPKSPYYNKHVDLRTFDKSLSHENLWLESSSYDVIIVIGFNDDPVVPGIGSAIFVHIARADYGGTAGCIAFSKPDLFTILTMLKQISQVVVN